MNEAGLAGATGAGPCLVVDQLGFAWPSGHTALNHCSFSIPGPGLWMLVGGNGSGKSTLLRLIAGLLEPGRGRLQRPLKPAQVFQMPGMLLLVPGALSFRSFETMLSGNAVESCMLEAFDTVWMSVAKAGLGDRNARVIEPIEKAQRVLPSLVGWVRAWHQMVKAHVAALGLSALESAWVLTSLLPAMYLERVARHGRDKDLRERVGEVVGRLKGAIEAAGSPWATWDAPTRARVLTVVQRCVELFVRTSSPVEGRNGQLALHHHRTHHLTPALLKALTVIHNYGITRRDGTTAAERFVGRKHDDLFAHLVAVMPLPARPRVRSRKERVPLLAAA